MEQALAAAPTERADLGLDFPMVQIAILDAVNAIDRRYSVYVARPTTNQIGASQDAAAYTVLQANFLCRRAQLAAT